MTNPESSVSTSSIVDRMINTYARNLRQQRIGFAACLGVWGVVVCMALVALLWDWKGAKWWAQRRSGRQSFGSSDFKLEEKQEMGIALKPLHLRAADPVQCTSGLHIPQPAPPPSTRASSWSSLVNFFRSNAQQQEAGQVDAGSVCREPAPDQPRQTPRSAPGPAIKLKPFKLPTMPRPIFSSSKTSRAKACPPRRYHDQNADVDDLDEYGDTLDLRTGSTVERSYPVTRAQSGWTLSLKQQRDRVQRLGLQHLPLTKKSRTREWASESSPDSMSSPSSYVSPEHPYARIDRDPFSDDLHPVRHPLPPLSPGLSPVNPFLDSQR